MKIYNEDCITGAKIHLEDESIDLMICDPPFGINEKSFNVHYARNSQLVVDGYQEAPKDYYQFTIDWLTEAKRIMKPNASLYLISGWTNLRDVLNAVEKVNFFTINHLIWKYNFGVFTKTKFISSHYHCLLLKKEQKSKHIFNLESRFEFGPKGTNSELNYDLQDVFIISKQYQTGKVKNQNKLPDQLVQKMIQYSSNPGDLVCDFFLGNFTTAIMAKRLGRIPVGFEINKKGFDYFIQILQDTIEQPELQPKPRMIVEPKLERKSTILTLLNQ